MMTPTNDSVTEQGIVPKKVPLSFGENATCWMLTGNTSQLYKLVQEIPQNTQGKLLETELQLVCPQQSHPLVTPRSRGGKHPRFINAPDQKERQKSQGLQKLSKFYN